MRSVLLSIAVAAVLAGCGSDNAVQDSDEQATVEPSEASIVATAPGDQSDEAGDPEGEEVSEIQMFPDVIGAEAIPSGDYMWNISATLSSPYDTPERYADAWRVVGPDGDVFGERLLGHDHASEQPFTRSQNGIEIPADVTEVTIEGRDQQFGWGGDTFQLTLP